MTTLALHSALLTRRSVTALVRQPAFVAITLVQPAIWLLLFGALFETAVQIPGFGADGRSYLEYLTPGVVAMTALFSAAWAGTVYIEDMTLGVMDRMLASPVRRGAMMSGTIAYQSITAIVQTAVIIGIAYAAGARFDRPFPGIVLTFAAAVLLTVVFAALSNAVALLSRDQNALIGISQLLSLPLAFLSSAIMDPQLAPDWIQTVATYNPLDWAVVVSREGLAAAPDWAAIWPRLGALTALAIVMSWLATKAFAAYQRSV
ncbi:ABC transporter permease [Terrabacter sp. Soil810]|uniref:ABC transporter permease n=1 Tax=Terrabacter sp. Soil810 TaxID=1736418 RepID=UPI000710F873|nr:ABC transporter permease [Terrabacter sp. Soil810]KRF38373.1 multidrug ABC transporter permease [Terrabacter sp. Soil810]